MGWTNTSSDEVQAPSNVPFAPGNNVTGFGTTVPAELAAAGIFNAIVFYGTLWNPSATYPQVKYQYTAVVGGSLVTGMCYVANASANQTGVLVTNFQGGLLYQGGVAYNDFELFDVNGHSALQIASEAANRWIIVRDAAGNTKVQLTYSLQTLATQLKLGAASFTVPDGGSYCMVSLPLISDTQWTPLPLNTGWVSDAGNPGEYRLMPDGTVEVRGRVTKSTTPTAGEKVWAALPSAYQPPHEEQFLVTFAGRTYNGTQKIVVNSDGSGSIYDAGTGTGDLSLAPIRYSVLGLASTQPGSPPVQSGAPSWFVSADWLWKPIPSTVNLDPISGAMVSGITGGNHVANVGGVDLGNGAYGNCWYVVNVGDTPSRGTCPLSSGWGGSSIPNVPWKPGLVVAPASLDGGVGILDYPTGRVISLWEANPANGGWTATAGSALDINGDGRETGGWTSTGSCLARAACLLTKAEVTAGVANHALFFSSNKVANGTFRYPATKTDGNGGPLSSGNIPEGTRFQLDPSLNIASYPALTAIEKVVFTALQKYGAYCGDVGGSSVAIACEINADSSNNDYTSLSNIPWGSLRALSSWNGA